MVWFNTFSMKKNNFLVKHLVVERKKIKFADCNKTGY